MKEQGCDLIIAFHILDRDANHVEGMENASVVLAGVDGIDALVTGHNHLVFPSPTFADRPGIDVETGTLMGKPAVMGGFWGSHLGLLDLLLEREGNEWRVVTSTSEARAISKTQ